MVQNGATLYEVQAVLGHQVAITTQRYAHLSQTSVRRTADRIADHISGLTKPKKEQP